MLARFHPRMGSRSFGQRKSPVHHRTQSAIFDKWPCILRDLLRQQCFELRRTRPQSGAGQSEAAAHHYRHVELRLCPALHRDRDMASLFGEALEIAWHIIARDHVQHQIDPLAASNPGHLRDEILALVINRMGGPEFQRARAFFRAAAGDDDRQVKQPAERNRHGADAAGAAVDQDRFALFGPAALEDIVPDGKQRFRQGRSFGQRQPFWHRQTMPGIGSAIFSITAARNKRADVGSQQFVRDARAQRHDCPGDLEAGDRRSPGGRRI